MVTGTCGAIEIAENRVLRGDRHRRRLPYAPYMANTFIVAFPRAGMALDDSASWPTSPRDERVGDRHPRSPTACCPGPAISTATS